jgi:signal transduction histidine kinase
MKESIFKRLFKIIIITAVGAVVAAIFFCSFTVKQYFLSVNMNEIKQETNTLAIKFVENGSSLNGIVESDLMKSAIIQCYDKSRNEISSEYNHESFTDETINEALDPYIGTVLKGNSVKGVTKLYGVGDDVVLVGEPIKQNGKIIGAMFFIKIAYQLTSSLKGFYIVLGVSMILSLISIIIPLYIFIKRMIKPLDNMTSATIDMAKGKFSTRIEQYKEDEIGELTSAFNYLASKLEENDEQAKLLEQTRRDYIANISHELKTPVASIRAIGETLNDDIFLERIDRKKYYSMILRESMRLELLIEDMLELSRLQSGNVALEKSFVSIEEIIHEVVDEFEVRADDLDINFNASNNLKDIPMLVTNKNRIIQVLVILLDNAFKFTEAEGNVNIEVEEEEEFVRVSVCDNGHGIDKSDMPFIFDRFYKVDKAHSSIGTGIGLSIAYEIMKHLDENIYVKSEIGKGSKFIFTIKKACVLKHSI